MLLDFERFLEAWRSLAECSSTEASAHDLNGLSDFPQVGLGKSSPVVSQVLSGSPPKPFEDGPPDKRNAAPVGSRRGEIGIGIQKQGASSSDKYSPAAAASTGTKRKGRSLRTATLRKFAGETSAQQAGHLEIARRYAWKSRNRRGRFNVRDLVRMRELEELFAFHYGPVLPEDDAGRDDLFVAANQIAQITDRPSDAITAWTALWAPWASPEEVSALVDQVVRKPLRWSADKIAWRLGVTFEVRTGLGFTTIGSIDVNKEARKQRRQRKKNAGKTAHRREAGAVTRVEYEAGSVSRQKPWEALGMSRATWYRKGKPEVPPVVRETSPGAPDVSHMVGPQLSQDGSARDGAESTGALDARALQPTIRKVSTSTPSTQPTVTQPGRAHARPRPSSIKPPDNVDLAKIKYPVDTRANRSVLPPQSRNLQSCTGDAPQMHPDAPDCGARRASR